jgi:hypothetical protein
MEIEITTQGQGRRPYRGTVNGVEFVGTAGFCRLVADLATEADGCIEGIGADNGVGYRNATVGGRKRTQHAWIRAFYENLEQPPDGLHAAHGPCHNRSCVNPHHVSFKTRSENEHDKVRDGTHDRGERHIHAKLTNDQVVELRKLYATGRYTQMDLGRRYGMAQRSISQIVRRVTYSYVEAAT